MSIIMMGDKHNQTAGKLEKTLNNWIQNGNYKKAIDHSNNEANTRDFLIEPFFEILRYDKMDNYVSEFKLKFPDGSIKFPDMAIKITGNEPLMLVECKKVNKKLSGKPYIQLSKYYNQHKKSKIGILTNGIEYEFYSGSLRDNSILHKKPFFVFNLENYNSSDVEKLAAFDRINIDINSIVNNAEKKYFLESFNKGLFKTLYKPKKEFIRLVYNNMGFKGLRDKNHKKIFNLINSISLEELVEKIKIAESKESIDGVYTSSEETKAFDRIKTIISFNKEIKNSDLKRISYLDKKYHFAIVIDGMSVKKEVCRLMFSNKKKELKIGKETILLKNISPKEIGKHKSKLIKSALSKLNL